MKNIITDYTFNATSKTVTLGSSLVLDIRKVYAIVNAKTGKILYSPAGPVYASVSGQVVTLGATADLTGAANNDPLVIIYDTDLTTDVNTTINIATAGTVTKISDPVPAGRYFNLINLSTDTIWISTENTTPSAGGDKCFPLSGNSSLIGGSFEPSKKKTNGIWVYNVAANSKVLYITW